MYIRVTRLTARVLPKSLLQPSITAIRLRSVISSAVVAILILAGCENLVEIDSLPENSSAPASSEIPSLPQVKDGILYFATKSDFNAIADYLIENQDDDDLDGFELELPPFRSLRTEFDDLIDQFRDSDNGNLEIDRIVEDPVFETLLNHEGMMQIADTIYQVTREYVYSSHIDNVQILRKDVPKRSGGYSGNDVILSSTVPLVKYKIDRVTETPANPAKNMDTMGRGECYVFFNVPRWTEYKYRMKGSIWINNWGIYRSAGTELESQKIKRRWFRRWRHHKVNRIQISGKFSSRENGSTHVSRQYLNWVKYSAEEIRKTIIKDRDHSLVEIEISLTHKINHVFKHHPSIKFDDSCDGYRTWSAPQGH